MNLPSLEEVIKNFESRAIDGRDAHRLALFIKAEDVSKIGLELNDNINPEEYNKDVIEWNEENVMKQIAEDVEFGFEKALNQRGLSAGTMAEVVLMWAKILNEESVLAQKDNYAQYGLPIFKSAALAWGLENPIGDDTGSESKYAG